MWPPSRCLHLGLAGSLRLVLVLILVLGGVTGCKKEEAEAPKERAPDLTLSRSGSYVLALDNLTPRRAMDKDDQKELKRQLEDHPLTMYLPKTEKAYVRLGLGGKPGSARKSSYPKLRLRSDENYVYLTDDQVELALDDGAVLRLNATRLRMKPMGELPSDGVVSGPIEITGQVSVSYARGDLRTSGTFDARWHGNRSIEPLVVAVTTPPEGLVSGSVDVYFDHPIETSGLGSKIILTDRKDKPIHVTVSPTATDLEDYATHVRVQALELLPFEQTLSVTVAESFESFGGHKLQQAVKATFKTPTFPEELTAAGAKFTELSPGKNDPTARLQGDASYVGAWFGVRPIYASRLLKLVPAPTGSRTLAALVMRVRVRPGIKSLVVRVRKVARSPEQETPCMKVTLALSDGLPLYKECVPKDVPTERIAGPEGEGVATRWSELRIDVSNHAADESILAVLEASPLPATTNPASEPAFLIDGIELSTMP